MSRRLTDDTGVIQHATFDVPNRVEGYCADDVARALALVVRMEDLGVDAPPAGDFCGAAEADGVRHAARAAGSP